MLSRLAPLASTSRLAAAPRVVSLLARRVQAPRSRTPAPFATVSRSRPFSSSPRRWQATPVDEPFDISAVERVSDEVDVCIVGAGPAGLSAAIKLKQLANAEGRELRVVVLEKGPEVGESCRRISATTQTYATAGSHILSGAVIETRALDELIPDWEALGAPLNQKALSDSMRWLTPTRSFPMPHPPQMSNKGNYIISLSKLTRWMSEQAEELGVEIYPGFAGAQVLWTEDGTGVRGITTNEIGLDKNYQPKDQFEPGMEFHAKVTLFAEGAHGSLSKKVMAKLNLRDGKDVQTYGLGIKEVWKIKKEKHRPGAIQHTLGWPLDNTTYGGTWLYHMEDEMVSLGIVVGLDYPNPYLSPFKELQVRLVSAYLHTRTTLTQRRATATETSSAFRRYSRGWRMYRLRSSSAQRGRISVDPEAHFPRRRSHRLYRRIPQRSENQRFVSRVVSQRND